ncbi:hypothetical protein BZA77DRAFT_295182 [Pyronema omphalodes]|nr:hypothetical protein BZA77DRAFT_295743 [Pyronema omphalodes]KAI5814317.1 hypothetical protein BZA77DRAFT_295182 [Pyronema omphalodes]
MASLFSKPTSISTINKDMRVAVSIPRGAKYVSTVGSHLSRAYKERLERAGRSWATLENAAAAKDWHMMMKSGGSVFGMTGGGLVVGEKYKVPKPYAVLMRKIKETKEMNLSYYDPSVMFELRLHTPTGKITSSANKPTDLILLRTPALHSHRLILSPRQPAKNISTLIHYQRSLEATPQSLNPRSMASIQKTTVALKQISANKPLLIDAPKFAKPSTARTSTIKHKAGTDKENLSVNLNANKNKPHQNNQTGVAARRITKRKLQEDADENAIDPSRAAKRKLQHDEPSLAPVHALKRKIAGDNLDVVSPDATKRKFKDDVNHIMASLFSKPTSIKNINKDMRFAASIPRATKYGAMGSSHLSRAYKERLEKAGRSWAVLEKAAAAKDWHMVIKSGGSVFGMTGGLVVGEKYKVPKPYAVLMRKIRETK